MYVYICGGSQLNSYLSVHLAQGTRSGRRRHGLAGRSSHPPRGDRRYPAPKYILSWSLSLISSPSFPLLPLHCPPPTRWCPQRILSYESCKECVINPMRPCAYFATLVAERRERRFGKRFVSTRPDVYVACVCSKFGGTFADLPGFMPYIWVRMLAEMATMPEGCAWGT